MKHRSIKWDSLIAEAKKVVRLATHSLDLKSLPVALLPIARKWHASVIFQPLLTEGGLALTKGGFELYIRSRQDKVSEYDRSFAGGGGTLPKRIRFTVAHELSHALFFHWKGPELEPEPLVDGRRGPELKKLERECNQLAGELLVPAHLVKELHSSRSKISTPGDILHLSDCFAASPECVVFRLDALIRAEYDRSAAILLSLQDGQPRTIAAALGGAAARIMLSEDRDLSPEVSNCLSRFSTKSREAGIFALKIAVGGRPATQEVRAQLEPLSNNRSLAWIELLGDPRLV